jgi:phosphonate transport system substrate-binding protein
MKSLQLVVDRQVDGAAIDSTVLESACYERPELAERLRVIETFGPSPIPPWVLAKSLPGRRQRELRSLLLNMHRDERGRAILERGKIACFVAARDHDYDPIRRMARAAESVAL